MQNISWPKIPRDLKKSVKLSTVQYPQIIELSLQGQTLKEIAEKFDVSQTTIYYVLNPDKYIEHSRKSELTKLKRLHTDNDFRKKHNRQTVLWQRVRIKNDEEFKKYWYFIHNQSRIKRGDNKKPRTKEARHLEYLRRKTRVFHA